MSERPRIAIAGFQHETNSFSHLPADLPAFEMADSWPPLLRGAEVIAGTKGLNLPIAGFAKAAEGVAEVVPILWASAEPSGPVTSEAFETILGEVLAGVTAAGADALYLDLHGAMIAEGYDDGEAEILRRIRAVVGREMPIAISLDMHANLSAEVVALADVICIFRTYPHLDMAATGARCLPRLLDVMDRGRLPVAFRPVPYLIPLHAQFTGMEPADGLYAGLEDGRAAWSEFAVGFTGGDTGVTGPSVLAYGAEAEARVEALLARVLAAEAAFQHPLPAPETVVAQAMAMAEGRPIVIADVQDNPGGGGSSDTTGVLKALVAGGAQGAVLGVMHDPEAAAAAHRAGLGAEITLEMGGRSGQPGDTPFHATFAVEALSDGRVVYEGEMYGGGIAQIGPSALLRVSGAGADVRVLVSSVRNQCLDRGYFRHIGVEPEAARILAVKSTVHFRADFEPIAQAILPTAAPGALGCLLREVPYRRLRDGVRLGPKGPRFKASSRET